MKEFWPYINKFFIEWLGLNPLWFSFSAASLCNCAIEFFQTTDRNIFLIIDEKVFIAIHSDNCFNTRISSNLFPIETKTGWFHLRFSLNPSRYSSRFLSFNWYRCSQDISLRHSSRMVSHLLHNLMFFCSILDHRTHIILAVSTN